MPPLTPTHNPTTASATEVVDGSVRAVERAADILLSFSEQQPVQDVPSLQQATGLSRPTLYRLLRSLETKGLVYSFGQPRRFQLGHRMGALLSTWEQHPPLAALARAPLEDLWRHTQETVAMMVPVSATDRRCVLELKSPQAISFSRGTGYTEPLHRGASGKVLLAYLPAARQLDAMAALPRKAREALQQELATIRRQGWWVTHAELIPGSVALAAPVLNPGGEVLASVCVFGLQLRMPPRVLNATRRALQAAALEVSALL